MGRDKAMLRLGVRPLVEIAVEKLREVCEVVSIAGNRDDLAGFAPVVREARMGVGPGAGVEAGLRAGLQEWCMFVPVDVPSLPASLLRWWAAGVVGSVYRASYLSAGGVPQPTICMARRDDVEAMGAALDGGERRLRVLLESLGRVQVRDVAEFGMVTVEVEGWFRNLNTPEDFAAVDDGSDGVAELEGYEAQGEGKFDRRG